MIKFVQDSKLRDVGLLIIYYLFNTITLTIFDERIYDFFNTYKYWKNRRMLMKMVVNKELRLICRYWSHEDLVYCNDDIIIVVYRTKIGKQIKLTQLNSDKEDIIGIYASSSRENRYVYELAKAIEDLTTDQNLVKLN